MTSRPTTCAAFTGHRTYRHEADESLLRTIRALHDSGIRSFLSGMAIGFDLAAAEAVLNCRESLPDIRLVAVIPFRGQQQRFSATDRARFDRIGAEADETVVLSESYHSGVYAVRNDYLVAHAATLITWYDGSAGGTRYTVEQALSRGRRLIHLNPATPPDVRPMPELFR
ncbi:MAG: DUF1273 domain-containing protein [Alistipes senegalensis]|nr:DUF1273 domain-containing protein [Bacteroides cellulosilyticus]MCM1351128.1 DUF1273 domain-containing protein [Alistipes senegalensis]